MGQAADVQTYATKPLTRPDASGHPLPSERVRNRISFSLGEKVAEVRGRMRGFSIRN